MHNNTLQLFILGCVIRCNNARIFDCTATTILELCSCSCGTLEACSCVETINGSIWYLRMFKQKNRYPQSYIVDDKSSGYSKRGQKLGHKCISNNIPHISIIISISISISMHYGKFVGNRQITGHGDALISFSLLVLLVVKQMLQQELLLQPLKEAKP